MSQCYRDTEGWWRAGRHEEHPADWEGACPGCEPCEPRDEQGNPLDHCTARGSCGEHVPRGVLTCNRCIGKARATLTTIETLSAVLIDEAIEVGVDSEAANLAGPAADPEAVMWRRTTAARPHFDADGILVHSFGSVAYDEELHPLSVLGTWDFMLREDYDLPTGLQVTVSRSVAFLSGLLTKFANDKHQDFPLFVREIGACRAHLEDVLHEGHRVERGARCAKCQATNLIKRYRDNDKTGAKDVWFCPAAECRDELSEGEYRLYVAREHARQADRLPAREMAVRVGVPEGTIRRWAGRRKTQETGEDPVWHPPLLRSVGVGADLRKLYRVTDVEALRDGRCAWPLDIKTGVGA